MTEDDARRLAAAAAPTIGAPRDYEPGAARRAWIEVAPGAAVDAPPPAPAPLRDVDAWIVALTNGMSFIEVAFDDATGRVVRVRRSR